MIISQTGQIVHQIWKIYFSSLGPSLVFYGDQKSSRFSCNEEYFPGLGTKMWVIRP